MQDPRFFPLVLHRLPDVGPVTYSCLIEHFGSAESVLSQSHHLLEPLLKPSTLQAIVDFQCDSHTSPIAQQVLKDLAWLDAQPNVHVLILGDAEYPALLSQIPKPPPILFVRGDLTCLSLPQIAIVGSRNPSGSGAENAQRFAHYLAANGFAITSGLALGVDAAAHEGALMAQGKTVAVMGTGIDKIYPARHRSLAQTILEAGGVLVSEFPLGTGAQAAHFPQRNRIISGLSWGVLVVEAAIQSGSLITAKLALQQNREVFAIPGSIHNPLARGCHQLIRQGATLVETAADIVEQLDGMLSYQRHALVQSQKKRILKSASDKIADDVKVVPATLEQDISGLSLGEQQLIKAMGFDPVTIDELIERTDGSVGSLMAQLVGLEIKGFVQQIGAGYQRV